VEELILFIAQQDVADHGVVVDDALRLLEVFNLVLEIVAHSEKVFGFMHKWRLL
jgi:hypothetical protein